MLTTLVYIRLGVKEEALLKEPLFTTVADVMNYTPAVPLFLQRLKRESEVEAWWS